MERSASRALAGAVAILLGLALEAGEGRPAVSRAAGRGPEERLASLAGPLREVIAIQIALEAHGYSPGLLDGLPGARTRLALAGFQAARGLPATGEEDSPTQKALAADPERAFRQVRLSPQDLLEVDPPPRDWLERSRRRRLLYPSLASLVAERAHTSERCLAALNPGLDLAALKPGDLLTTPAPEEERRAAAGVARIEIDLEQKLVLLFAGPRRGAPAGLLFCSIAADPARAPVGESRVAVVAGDPVYTFDPAKWPEVHGISQKLRIPPGPRSPVGLRWIGLELDGIGIHGTPEPENIGKTGSHGCFRLTNWDAVWLAARVGPGTPVRILRTAGETSWQCAVR
jgi:peptidoglycan hydrolase-like protein with peptidoglycan-binding domain